ncbi:hypothetical protein PHLCEN_2v11846 [Hermanssonia centrifuga]|uniref:Uncharacterized protein n=1 Tax=Hermanssonia centrifuga TaxID=98765 RepID=A0A2R6NIR6_9APHY|nr:hypothetical protein PHLCEN_2v11846 [Hermanssonia centrifuga]
MTKVDTFVYWAEDSSELGEDRAKRDLALTFSPFTNGYMGPRCKSQKIRIQGKSKIFDRSLDLTANINASRRRFLQNFVLHKKEHLLDQSISYHIEGPRMCDYAAVSIPSEDSVFCGMPKKCGYGRKADDLQGFDALLTIDEDYCSVVTSGSEEASIMREVKAINGICGRNSVFAFVAQCHGHCGYHPSVHTYARPACNKEVRSNSKLALSLSSEKCRLF